MRSPVKILFDPLHLFLQRLSLSVYATIFVALVCCALLAGHAYRVWTAYQQELRAANVSLANLVRGLSQHAEDAIRNADSNLVNLVARIEHSGMQPSNLASINKMLNLRQAEFPEPYQLLVVDEKGNGVAASLEKLTEIGMNFSDRAFFRFHRTSPDRSLHVWGAVPNVASSEWILPISRRINHADGRFAGVALAAIKITYFQKFYDSFDIGRAGMILMTLEDGIVVARRPFDVAKIGSSIADGPLYTEYLSKEASGSALTKSVLDGVERLYDYHHLDQFPIIVTVGFARNDILAAWRKDAIRDSIAVAVLVGILSLLGLGFVRQVKNLSLMKDYLAESRRRLRKLSEHQEQIKEQERIRIARDIHDDLGQNLLALKFDIAMLHERTSGMHPRLHERVGLALQNIDVTMSCVRSIINDLRPATLQLGLHAAADWQLKKLASMSPIKCTLMSNDTDFGLTEDQTTAVFRILQESLSNIVRHARAGNLTVTLHKDASQFSMTVTDDGIGIDPVARKKIKAFGLIGIKERIHSLGGEFSIEGKPGKGTKLVIAIPLRRPYAAAGQGCQQAVEELSEED